MKCFWWRFFFGEVRPKIVCVAMSVFSDFEAISKFYSGTNF